MGGLPIQMPSLGRTTGRERTRDEPNLSTWFDTALPRIFGYFLPRVGGNIQVGQWTHVAAVTQNGSTVVYVNGVEVGRGSAPPGHFLLIADDLDRYSELLLGIESRTPLLWTINFCRDAFDRADRASALARTVGVRAAQKARRTGAGHGATAATWLVPFAR